MASPKQAIIRQDLSMTLAEFSTAMNRKKYIGHLVFPPLSVGEQSSEFAILPAAALLTPIEDTKRAPKGGYSRGDWEWDKDDYATTEHGVEEVVDDRLVKIYRNEINAESISRERAVNRVAQAYEATAAALAFDTTYFDGDHTKSVVTDTASGFHGKPWSDKTDADPIQDIDAGREVFAANCGHEPNAMVLDHSALLKVIRTARVEDLVKPTGRLDDQTIAKLMPQLQEVFQLEKIIVADSPIKNTAGHGAAAKFSRIWNNNYALLCRIYDGEDLEYPEPFLGRTLMWSEEAGPLPGADSDGIGVLVEEYREENRRGGVIRARTDYEIKRFYKPAGLLLQNVMTAPA